MSEEKTITDIIRSIDELAARAKISRSRAFSAWYAINFHDIDEDDALEAASADGGNDQGIDIVFLDERAQQIFILQAYLPENLKKATPKSKWDAVVSSIAYIKSPEMLKKQGRFEIAESIKDLKERYPDYGISVGLISMGLGSNEIARSVEVHSSQKGGEEIGYLFQSQEDILSQYRQLIDAEAGIPEDSVTFSGGYFEDNGEYGRAWVGSVSASELKRLFHLHQNKLFAGNIRLFLGSRKGGINEQIMKTAKESPGVFWALNNGITIVADSADKFSSEGGGDSKLELKRFSIVNGCQTTSCIVRSEAKDSLKVLTRIIAAKGNLKNEIVRYNNSQNAIKIWTVRAVDDVQERLRDEFKKIGIQYAPKQEGARKRRDPKIIELDKLTQFLAARDKNFLIQAIDNKSELFDEPYQKLFKKGMKATNVYLAWLLGGQADLERQKMLEKLKGDANAGLLSVTSTFWIVYAAEKLLEKFSDVGSPQITLERMLTEEFQAALRKYVVQAVELFYGVAVDTYEKEEYGSIKSTLRSTRFLNKIDSKMNLRVAKFEEKALPKLENAAKSAKVRNEAPPTKVPIRRKAGGSKGVRSSKSSRTT